MRRAILSVPEDAALFEAYYKAFVGLNRAAARPSSGQDATRPSSGEAPPADKRPL